MPIDNGNLYAAGWNNKGQLGFVSECCEVPLLTCVPNVPKVQSVACGWNHTLILSGKHVHYKPSFLKFRVL